MLNNPTRNWCGTNEAVFIKKQVPSHLYQWQRKGQNSVTPSLMPRLVRPLRVLSKPRLEKMQIAFLKEMLGKFIIWHNSMSKPRASGDTLPLGSTFLKWESFKMRQGITSLSLCLWVPTTEPFWEEEFRASLALPCPSALLWFPRLL